MWWGILQSAPRRVPMRGSRRLRTSCRDKLIPPAWPHSPPVERCRWERLPRGPGLVHIQDPSTGQLPAPSVLHLLPVTGLSQHLPGISSSFIQAKA